MAIKPHVAFWPLLLLLSIAPTLAAPADDGNTQAPEDKPLKIKMAQACFFSVIDGKLVADSKLKGARLVDQTVEVEGLSGSSVLTLKPEFLKFENRHAVSDAIESLNVENRNDVVRIERDGREATV